MIGQKINSTIYKGTRTEDSAVRLNTSVLALFNEKDFKELFPCGGKFPRDYYFSDKFSSMKDSEKRDNAANHHTLYFEWGDCCNGSLWLAMTIINDYFLNDGGMDTDDIPVSVYFHFMKNVIKNLPYES